MVVCVGVIDSGSSSHTVGHSRLTRRGTKQTWDLSGRGTTRAEDAQGTPTQSHMSPSLRKLFRGYFFSDCLCRDYLTRVHLEGRCKAI